MLQEVLILKFTSGIHVSEGTKCHGRTRQVRTWARCHKLLAMYPERQLKSRLQVPGIDSSTSRWELHHLSNKSYPPPTKPARFWETKCRSCSKHLKITACSFSGLLANNVGVAHDKTPTKTKYFPVHHPLKSWCSFISCNLTTVYQVNDRLCGLVVRVSGYRYRGLGFDSRRYQIFWVVMGLERGPLSLVRSNEELLE